MQETKHTLKTKLLKGFVFLRKDTIEHPSKWLAVFLVFTVVLWSLQSAFLKNILSLDTVESVCWGAQMQLGYYKHPPLAAWIAYVASLLTFHSDWILYFLNHACLAVGAWYVYLLAGCFFDKRRAAASALLLYFLHYYNPSPAVFCPNPIQVCLQPVMAYCFYMAIRDGRWKHWLLLGLFSGLAFLGKYSAGLLLMAMFIGMCFHKNARKRFFEAGPWGAFAVFCIVVSPHIVWLVQHDFICLKYVDGSVGDTPPWFFLPLAIVTALYPILLQTGVMLFTKLDYLPLITKKQLPCSRPAGFCILQHYKRSFRFCPDREALYWSAFFTGLPALLLVLIPVFGGNVVMTWFSTMASWTGMFVLALLPCYLTKDMFRKLYFLAIVVTLFIFAGTSLDLLIRTRPRIHLEPELLTERADMFWKTRTGGKEIPCVFGDRWLANTLEHYLPYHPVSIANKDTVHLARAKQDGTLSNGVLVISDDVEEVIQSFDILAPDKHCQVEHFVIPVKAPWGKSRFYDIFLMYLPPE